MNLDALFTRAVGYTLSLGNVLIILAVTLALGFLISGAYLFTHRKTGYTQDFLLTLIMLPMIISILILLINNNLGIAFTVGGAFTLIRFRSTLRETKDLSYIFFAIATGIGCGIGYIAYAVLFAIILCAIMVVLDTVGFGKPKNNTFNVKITVPESLNYQGVFDDVLNKYSATWVLKRVKTVDFGALFEVTYRVGVKGGVDQKAMIDELRTLNGNLPVQVTLYEYEMPSE